MKTKNSQVVNPVEGVVVQVISESAKTAQFSLPVNQLDLIDDALAAFFKADNLVFDAEELTRKAAKKVAVVLGTEPTYEHWMGVRGITIGRAMAQKPTLSEDAAQKYWERTICGYLDKECGLTKPKKDGDAEKKRKQREAQAKKFEKYTDSQLVEKAKECAMAFNFDEGKKFAAEIKRRETLNNAGLAEECKAVRGEIVLRMKGCLNLELLEEIRDMLPEPVIKAE